MLLCAEGVQYSLAPTQEGVFVVLSDTVEAAIEGALFFVENGAEAHTLLHLRLSF